MEGANKYVTTFFSADSREPCTETKRKTPRLAGMQSEVVSQPQAGWDAENRSTMVQGLLGCSK